MASRPICKKCAKNPCAVNYKRKGRTFYRSKCSPCIRLKGKLPVAMPLWKLAGYRKAKKCEKCGFKPRYVAQLFVYHVDGELNNVKKHNLKTICANCQIEVAIAGLGWIQGDLTPDF